MMDTNNETLASTNDNIAVKIRGLKKRFSEDAEYILNGMDIDIPRGKITMIIGFSGTGKSVLMKHILGLLKPTEGSIEVLGKDLNSLTPKESVNFLKNFGVMFQYAALFDDMTALENAAFPLKEHRRDINVSEREKMARQKLEMCGLDPKHFGKLPAELSGGMRKRVGLARAIALDPKILLYDEPTTGLDPVLTEMVDDLIKTTHEKIDQATSVVISHDLHAAFRIGDLIVMLHEGKVIMSGTPAEFLSTDHPLVSRFVSKGVRK